MKIINKYILFILSLGLMMLLTSCHNHTEGDGHDHGHSHSHGVHSHAEGTHAGHGHGHGGHGTHNEDGKIRLTKKQIETIGLKFGEFSEIKIDDFVTATGTLGLPPNAYAGITAKSSGIVRNGKKFIEGSYIKKGEVVAYVENPEFIQKQQEYLELSAELIYIQQDLERQKKLVDANAGVKKTLQKLQSEAAVKDAQMKGTAKYLTYLGIDPYNLNAENIKQQIPITATMSGYITAVNMHNGMYVEPRIELLQIINNNHLHLELDVFEKDIAKIEKGQKISYTVPALGNTAYEGEVNIIGKEFNTENRTVRVHGHLENEKPQFIKDLFISAKIWLTDQTIKAMPEDAIIRDGETSYIYAGDANTENDEIIFEKLMVIPGVSDNGFTAFKLLDEIPEGLSVVTEGAYYVYAQSKAGQLAHEH